MTLSRLRKPWCEEQGRDAAMLYGVPADETVTSWSTG